MVLNCMIRYKKLLMKISSTTGMVLLGVGVFGALILAAVLKSNAPSKYDDLAQCLTDKGVQMYGAHWCSACAQQKELFGSAFRKVEYVECSSPGSRTFDLCTDITSTPTWEGEEGRLTGVRTPEALAQEYGCEEYIPS